MLFISRKDAMKNSKDAKKSGNLCVFAPYPLRVKLVFNNRAASFAK